MRVLLLATDTTFSLPTLLTLLRSQHEVNGVVIPGHRHRIPCQTGISRVLTVLPSPSNHTTVGLALRHNIPVWRFEDVPHDLTADVIIVACFPSRLPGSFLRRAGHAALNIHPSWLPEYRGPSPLFWQLRDGLRTPGVTVHHMTWEIDAGDIVAQTRISLPEGVTGTEADRMQSEAGASLMLDILNAEHFRAQPQVGTASYQSWPVDKDWNVPTDWPVQRAFNFMRGTAEWKHPFTLLTQPKPLVVRGASDYALGAAQQGSTQPMQQGWRAGFSDGWLMVR